MNMSRATYHIYNSTKTCHIKFTLHVYDLTYTCKGMRKKSQEECVLIFIIHNIEIKVEMKLTFQD